jgi:hypothetical protein
VVRAQALRDASGARVDADPPRAAPDLPRLRAHALLWGSDHLRFIWDLRISQTNSTPDSKAGTSIGKKT